MIVKHSLIEGVEQQPLTSHECARGSTTEIYRRDDNSRLDLIQWNLISSNKHSLRGMQVHLYRTDYLCVMHGKIRVGLYDLRPNSPTRGNASIVELRALPREVLIIPPGVIHGMYFPEATTYVQGMTTLWTGKDDYRCIWNDPALKLDWHVTNPIISELDQNAASLAALKESYLPLWAEKS